MDASELPTDVEQLKALLLLARQQVAQLSTTVSEQQQKLAAQERQIIELLKALRGKQRERVDPDQLLLFEIGELEQLIEEQIAEDASPRRRRRQKHGRRLIPDGLPEEVIAYELDEQERVCPVDGQPMPRIRWEESKQLDYVPARLKVIVHRRAVYACPARHDQAELITADKPPQPIEKGLAAAGLLAQVVISKFGDHLPGYRQEDIFSRHGIEIRRSTIYDWLSGVADLCRPLYELMKARVLQSKVIHTDDTQVKMIDKTLRSTRLARFWAYLGDRDHPYVVYDFTEDRSRDGPQQFLKDFSGFLQADAYGGYDGVYLKSHGAIHEVACWAHCRRYWHKAREQDPERAHHVLAVISRLYEVERATADCDAETRRSQRAEHAEPLLGELQQWLDEQAFLPKSLAGKAATYTGNQWAALNRYLDDGDLSIDNNRAERAMRPLAIGRKNWLFVGSPRAGDRAAILASLVASCKDNGVEPWAYLRGVFARMARQPGDDELDQLLPERWLEAHPEHRWNIAETRRQERIAKL
jgi:transposase